jgi:hypothetical protein
METVAVPAYGGGRRHTAGTFIILASIVAVGRLTYVIFTNTFDGKQLHARIDQMWAKLNLAEDLSVGRLNVLMTIGIPPALPKSW